MSDHATETPVLDLLAGMTKLSLDATTLDEKEVMLVRIAALVATNAPPISYSLNLKVAGEVAVEPDDVRGVLAAIAPIVGAPRIAAAVGNVARALAFEQLTEVDEPGGE